MQIDEKRIKAIRKLDAKVMRELIGEKTSYEAESITDAYEYLKNMDLAQFLGVRIGQKFDCILPTHTDDNDLRSKANIFTTDDSILVYKCFGCEQSLTIDTLVEAVARCKRRDAVKFLKEVYDIKETPSEWIEQQNEILESNLQFLSEDTFKITFPAMSKLIRTRKKYFILITQYFKTLTREKVQMNGNALYFASLTQLLKACDYTDKTKLSQSITLFTFLGLIDKIDHNDLPYDILNKAKETAAKNSRIKLVNFYRLPELGYDVLRESEANAKILIKHHISMVGLSREYIICTFGQDKANTIFPQYKKENKCGPNILSICRTNKITREIMRNIKNKGYILEADIKKFKTKEGLQKNSIANEIQWKKSIHMILEENKLKIVKASAEIKEEYNIPLKVSYQAFVITEDRVENKVKDRITRKIMVSIEEKNYILDRDIKTTKSHERQWKKSKEQILEANGLIRVRASAKIKIKYEIPLTVAYQTFVIVKDK